jgi:hypothetical protein
MGETRRKFDQDFKEGAVRLVRETGKPSDPRPVSGLFRLHTCLTLIPLKSARRPARHPSFLPRPGTPNFPRPTSRDYLLNERHFHALRQHRRRPPRPA